MSYDVTEIARLQLEYNTAMTWAEQMPRGSERQLKQYARAAVAQYELANLAEGDARTRHLQEHQRLYLLIRELKDADKPQPQVVTSNGEAPAPQTKKPEPKPEPPEAATEDENKPTRQTREIHENYTREQLDGLDLSTVRFTDPAQLKLGFDDLVGVDEERKRVVDFFTRRRQQRIYKNLSQAASTGKVIEKKMNMMLYGPAGTGKSSFLSAMGRYLLEQEEDSVVFLLEADAFRSRLQGVSEKVIDEVFHQARQFTTALVCIDEVISLCPKDPGNQKSARDTLTKFLNEVDGIGNVGGDVIVVGGTNYPWDVDPAAISRLGERIYIPLPVPQVKVDFLMSHAAAFLGLTRDEQLACAEDIAAKVPHASFRELKKIAGELYEVCWKKTVEANPDNTEVSAFIPATEEEINLIIGRMVMPYDEAYIRRLQDPSLW